MPIHPLWILMLFIVVLIVLVPVVVLVVVMSRQSFNSSRLATRIHYSPDGRWWWDGLQWQPVPRPPTPASSPQPQEPSPSAQ